MEKFLKSFEGLKEWKIPPNFISYEIKKIPQKNGSSRTLEIPNEDLAQVQKMISKYLSRSFQSAFNFAFQPCWSYLNAVNRIAIKIKQLGENPNYLETPILYKIDIKEFFQSTRPEKFYDEMVVRNFDPAVIRKLISLCYYKNHLPTGAPTSPICSSIASEHMDRRLFAAIKPLSEGLARYADDYFFIFGDEANFKQAVPRINFIINDYGYTVNTGKTRKIKIKSHFKIMGIVGSINQNEVMISIPRSRRSQLLTEFKTADESTKRGYLAWLNSIEQFSKTGGFSLSPGMTSFLKLLEKAK